MLKKFAEQTNVQAEFICCNIYDLPSYLRKKFDIVFTSYGTISWLPDLNEWARLISEYVKPLGRFVFAEFHPVSE
jgi:ubiquinone/menaquinone biosynthesis C-methylase UbiE